MGIFTKEGRHGEDELRWGRIAGASISGLATAAALVGSLYVNEAREVSLEVTFGKVTNVITEPGINAKYPFITSRFPYSLARQTSYIGQETTLRTSDDVRLTNPFTIEFQIDESADVENLYYQLKGSGEDIEDVVQKLARDVGVRVFEGLEVTDLAEPGVTDRITTDMQNRLQAELSAKGWPVNIIDILSDGFKLSPESEGVLERIIDIRQESARLDLRQTNAEKAENVLRTEAQAYVAYAEELSAAGLPESDLRCAIYDKMAQDAGRVMEPFSQVCGVVGASVGQDIAVAVDPANVNINPAVRQAVPAPAGQ